MRTDRLDLLMEVRDCLAEHFVMWTALDGSGPRGEWRCECGAIFGFSDTAIDHQADALTDLFGAIGGAK